MNSAVLFAGERAFVPVRVVVVGETWRSVVLTEGSESGATDMSSSSVSGARVEIVGNRGIEK